MPEFSVELKMILALLIGLLVSLLVIPPVVRVAKLRKLVAVPNGRTSHQGLIPSLGGVALFASVVIGTSLFVDAGNLEQIRYLVPALLIIFFIGLKDDLVDLGMRKKLIGEVVAALIVVVLADVRIRTFHGMLGIYEINYGFSIVFSVFVILVLINSFNLLDGIDGLASGMGIVISVIFGHWLFLLGYINFAILAYALAGGLFAFFIFNVFGRDYKLFMGDTGSLLLGFLFAILAIKILCCELPPMDPLFMKSLPTVVMGVMIIPIIDTLRVFTARILKGRSPFSADRTHLHHNFLQLGFSHIQASGAIIGMNVGLFLLALMMKQMNPVYSATILFSTAIISILIPCYLAESNRIKSTEVVADHHLEEDITISEQ